MSVTRSTSIACPACGRHQDFDLIHSVNADRRADLRQAILDQTFQYHDCLACGRGFRVDPSFSYFHLAAGLWIAVFPSAERDDWRGREASARAVYDSGYGMQAPHLARALCAAVRPRLVFGWTALREKLVAQAAGLDDLQLELTKLLILRAGGPTPFGKAIELRLIAADASDLHFARIIAGRDELLDELTAPRGLYDQIDLESPDWRPLRRDFAGALFVDIERLYGGAARTAA